MNPNTGVFIVPVSGSYSFSLSTTILINYGYTQILVYKNGAIESIVGDYNKHVSNENDQTRDLYYIGFTWQMSLLQNDQIYLKRSINDYPHGYYKRVWFNGQLSK